MSMLAAVPLALAALTISAWGGGCSWCSLAGTLLAYGAGLLMRFDVRARRQTPSSDVS